MIGDIAITRPKITRGAGLHRQRSCENARLILCFQQCKSCPDVAVNGIAASGSGLLIILKYAAQLKAFGMFLRKGDLVW